MPGSTTMWVNRADDLDGLYVILDDLRARLGGAQRVATIPDETCRIASRSNA
jgi:hypothetical protein